METVKGWRKVPTLINMETGLQARYSFEARKERKKRPHASVTFVVTSRVSNGRGVPLNTGALVSVAIPLVDDVFVAAPLDVAVPVGARIPDDEEEVGSTALGFNCCGSLVSTTIARGM